MLIVCWNVFCQLAPWLLLGMLLSGLLHVLLPVGFVRRKFQGKWGVIKSVLLGVPLPLCSCGVIPAGIGLKNQGASNGAAVGFLISTPQTGIDSILVSASFFGWPFAIFKMVVAGFTGVVGGWLTDHLESGIADAEPEQLPVHTHDHEHQNDMTDPAWKRCWDHGVEIVQSIWLWLVLGIVLSAAIKVLIPASVFEAVGSWGLIPSMLIVLLVSTPLYVCATASVPIAAALVVGGLPPAAALVFLMAGPATNITTIGAIYGRFGKITLAVYLSTIILGSMFFAWMFDWLLTAEVVTGDAHDHDHNNWWSIASAIILGALLASFAWSDIRRWTRRYLAANRSNDSGQQQTKLKISGMTCGGCVNKLESAIRKMEGVESVVVELGEGIATIQGEPHQEQLRQLVRRLGFQVVPD
jgi:uncharacterized membrane protein YraQ (UPF0718 family)/copper chaperone CopZ